MSTSDFGPPRSPEMLSRANCKLLVVDVQEKLLPLIKRADRLVSNCRFVLQGAQILGVPVYATEQYPQGLGATTPPLAELLPKPAEKRRFSCAEVLNWGGAAEQPDDRHQVVVVGIEAHVCVQQSVLDLIAQGFQVFVAADAVASRSKFDWRIALQRMALSGAVITTSESVVFEWCETAATAEFKQISDLVKQRGNG